MNADASNNPSEPSDTELMEQVALWLLKIESEECTKQDLIDFRDWQQQHPRYAAMVKQMQSTFEQFARLKQQPQSIPHQIVEQAVQQSKTEQVFKSNPLLLIAFLTIFSVLLWQILPTDYWLADTRNRYHQWSEHTLPDHSEIRISGQSAYNILFSQDQRRIELLDGNILVDVAKDTHRPFIISTEFAQIQALGTRFIVQHHDQATILTMLHSSTEVTAQLADGRSQVQQIQAGEQVMIDGEGIHSKRNIPVELVETAWQQHMLMIDLMPLDQVLDILQSYEKHTLKYDAKQLENIEVTAMLPLDGTGLDLLQSSLPIVVQEDMFGRKHIVKK